MGQIFPPLSARTPLASLGGWNLVLSCPKCGERIKSVDALFRSVRLSQEIGKVVPRLICDVCRSKPVAMRAVCAWVRTDPVQPAEDLTFLLPDEPQSNAAD